MNKKTIKKMEMIKMIVGSDMQKIIRLLKTKTTLTEGEINKILKYRKRSRLFFYYKKRLQYFGLLDDVLVTRPTKNKDPCREERTLVGNRLTKKCLRIVKQLDAIRI